MMDNDYYNVIFYNKHEASVKVPAKKSEKIIKDLQDEGFFVKRLITIGFTSIIFIDTRRYYYG